MVGGARGGYWRRSTEEFLITPEAARGSAFPPGGRGRSLYESAASLRPRRSCVAEVGSPPQSGGQGFESAADATGVEVEEFRDETPAWEECSTLSASCACGEACACKETCSGSAWCAPSAPSCDEASPPVWPEWSASAGFDGAVSTSPKWETGHEPPLQSPGMPSAPSQHGIEQPCAPSAEPDGTAPAATTSASAAAIKALATARAFGVVEDRGRKLVPLQSMSGAVQEARRWCS